MNDQNYRSGTTPRHRKKKFNRLANSFSNGYLDAIHVQVIAVCKYYVGEMHVEQATAATLNIGPEYMVMAVFSGLFKKPVRNETLTIKVVTVVQMS